MGVDIGYRRKGLILQALVRLTLFKDGNMSSLSDNISLCVEYPLPATQKWDSYKVIPGQPGSDYGDCL
jgi:hypothetical protein